MGDICAHRQRGERIKEKKKVDIEIQNRKKRIAGDKKYVFCGLCRSKSLTEIMLSGDFFAEGVTDTDVNIFEIGRANAVCPI